MQTGLQYLPFHLSIFSLSLKCKPKLVQFHFQNRYGNNIGASFSRKFPELTHAMKTYISYILVRVFPVCDNSLSTENQTGISREAQTQVNGHNFQGK